MRIVDEWMVKNIEFFMGVYNGRSLINHETLDKTHQSVCFFPIFFFFHIGFKLCDGVWLLQPLKIDI